MTGCPLHFDPLSPEQLADPYPLYSRMRDERPVFHDTDHELWIVTRHEDVLTVVRDTETYSSENAVRARTDPFPEPVRDVLATGWPLSPTLTDSDGDVHKRLRLIVGRSFTPRRVAELEGSIAAAVDDMIDGFAADGRADIIAQFGWHLPMLAITDIIGVPREDVPDLHHWSISWLRLLQATDDIEVLVECARDVVSMQRYFMDALTERAAAPRDDFMSSLLGARVGGQDELTLDEAMRVPMNLIIAGHVTVTRAIGNGLKLLFDHPDQLQALRADSTLATTTVEEVLRFESPAQGLFRTVRTATELGGVSLPEGARVMVHWGSANRDPAVFAEPDTFDVSRDSAAAHVAFGKGVHACLGAPLARMQLRIALPRLLERLPGLRLAVEPEATVRDTIFFARGFTRLVVEWDAANAVGR